MDFFVKTTKREEIVDITEEVEKAVNALLEKEKKIVCNKKPRIAMVYCLHTTSAIIINEVSDKDICEDLLAYLKKEIPQGKWKHDCEEGNADSHIKACLLGNSQLIPLENGKLKLGKWQRIGLVELDGPRERKIIVEII